MPKAMRLIIAVILLVAAAVIIATTGESIAVRFLLALVTLSIAWRLAASGLP